MSAMGFKSPDFLKPAAWIAAAFLALAPAAEAAPAKATAAKAEAPAPAPRPALWMLGDEDTKIYLFGTIHVLPPGFRWRSAALDKVVAEADELVVETYEDPATTTPEMALAGFFADTEVPILSRVPKKHRKTLKATIEASGIPATEFDRMHSWAAAMTLGLSQLLSSYGAEEPDDAPGVEDVLEAAFREAKKPILSVEDPMTVVASMSALPEEIQRQMLLDSVLPMPEGELDPALEDHLLWAAGRDEAMTLEDDAAFPPALYDALVTKRNAAWTEWLEERLKKPGTLLFAVGAGHLAGKDSVQRMLAERGLKVIRVD
jgi:uncharacterized protein